MSNILKISSPFNAGKYNCRLVLKENNNRLCVYVERDFHNNNKWTGIPSGWHLEDVKGLSCLCIDGGQNWVVYPTEEAWDDILL